MHYDVAIIGAGPAGMMAAITAGGNGRRVALIEKNPQPGRKLLATGNGRCNLTNVVGGIERYHGADMAFIDAVLQRFAPERTLEFFRELGLALKQEDHGRIFPRTDQAASVLNVLCRRMAHLGVDLLLDANVCSILREDSWRVGITRGDSLTADKLVLATGAKAAPALGSTGDGWYWAKRLGHTITAYYPALAPIDTVEPWPKQVQGQRVYARVTSTANGKPVRTAEGDVLFTSYGVSGPGVMAHAGAIGPLVAQGNVLLHINLVPEMEPDELLRNLSALMRAHGVTTVAQALVGLLPSGLVAIVLNQQGLGECDVVGSLQEAALRQLACGIQDVRLSVAAVRTYKEAQVTAGGIVSAEVDPRTLQSRLAPGLYFAGEMLDADGDSGGYNLQWAWASGYVAGLLG